MYHVLLRDPDMHAMQVIQYHIPICTITIKSDACTPSEKRQAATNRSVTPKVLFLSDKNVVTRIKISNNKRLVQDNNKRKTFELTRGGADVLLQIKIDANRLLNKRAKRVSGLSNADFQGKIDPKHRPTPMASGDA